MKLLHMTPPKLAEFVRKDPIAVLPLGTVEVHGRHLPLNTDMLPPQEIVNRLDARMDNLLVLPQWTFGNCDTQTEFPGTLSLGHELLYKVLYQVFWGLYEQGIRYFAVVNGHGPNARAIDQVAYEFHAIGAQVAELNWWRYVWDLNPAWKGGHGGGQETSAMLALAPECVDTSAYEPVKMEGIAGHMPSSGWDDVLYKGVNIPVPRPDIHVTDNGWLGDDPLESATVQQGMDMIQAAVDWAEDYLKAFHQLPVCR